MWLAQTIGHELWLQAVLTIVAVATTGISGFVGRSLLDVFGVEPEARQARSRAQVAQFDAQTAKYNAETAKFEAQIAVYKAQGAEALEREELARKRIAKIRR